MLIPIDSTVDGSFCVKIHLFISYEITNIDGKSTMFRFDTIFL